MNCVRIKIFSEGRAILRHHSYNLKNIFKGFLSHSLSPSKDSQLLCRNVCLLLRAAQDLNFRNYYKNF